MEEIRQTITEAIAGYERAAAALENVLLGQSFIVCCEGIYLAFDIDPQTREVSKPRSTRPQLATRFTKGDAERVAQSVFNGHGQKGQAVNVADAIRTALAENRKLLAAIEANQTNK